MEYFEKHPTLDMLELYLLNHLEAEDRDAMARHLKVCDGCLKMAAQMGRQIELIRESVLVG